MNTDKLIALTLEYRNNPAKFPIRRYGIPQKFLPCVTEQAWQEATSFLSFELPSLLCPLYTLISGGQFGPGYGLIPISGSNSLTTLYLEHRSWNQLEGSWFWPERLVPIVNWGCNIYSCVNCAKDDFSIIRYNSTLWSSDEASEIDERTADWRVCFRFESASLLDWWAQWLQGKDWWLMEGKLLPQWMKYESLVPLEKRQIYDPDITTPMPGQLAFDFHNYEEN